MMAYLLFPLMVYLLGAMCKRWQMAGAVAALLISFALIIFVFYGTKSIGDNIQSLGVLRCALEFFCGVCIWYLSRLQWSALQGKLMFYIGLVLFAVLTSTDIANYYYVPVTMCLVILGSVIYKSPVNDFFSSRSLIWLGNISYSIYLSHYLVRDWFKLLFLDSSQASLLWISSYVMTVLVISHFLYLYFEIPAKNLSLIHISEPTRPY